jgi:hypothetical protein
VLKAYGAEVVVCPTAVPPDDPRSYYRVSDRLAAETPGGWKPNQYANPANPRSHWVCERDSTVTGEIVSPVLRDTHESWAQLEKVCSILRDNGARATARTGGRPRGADSAGMDHDVNRFRRVAQTCA